ncbi:MAG: D-glycerate dehydrogenase [Candidatus Riflebacteria bacterium HGW-Riflebacteria-2]|nr:MAG: D-glycerate dehydrogenase [Candidatus Riflebacteria bacterium HGW-Riflebacteria-2]
MAKAKIFVTREIPHAGLQMLDQHFAVEVWPHYAPPSKVQLLEKVAEVEGMVTLLSDRIDAELLAAAAKLRFIAQYAVGYDNIDVAEASRRGIYVSNTPEVLTEASADFAFAQLMAVARRVVESDKYVRNGQWQVAWHPSMMLGYDVYGSTIGIIGAGRIGQAVARRARGFSMKVLYYSTSPKPDFERETEARRVELDELLREADFVSLHVPLNDGTRGLINADKLARMKKTAFLINNSRGPVVDEKALYEALRSGKIAGAALDVFENEPTPADNPLLTLNNVVLAPHISSASHATRARMAVMVAENLVAFFTGKRPPNLINP